MKVQVYTKNENSLSRGKKFGVAFLDFLSMFILSILLFNIFTTIYHKSSFYKNTTDSIVAIEKSLADICCETKLTYFVNEDKLATIEDVSKDYIKGQIYASFIINNDERINDKLFSDTKIMNPLNDPCFYYLNTFKTQHAIDFLSEDSKLNKQYYLDKILETNLYVEDEYPILTISSANEIYEYFKNSSMSNKAYLQVKEVYEGLLEESIADFMENNKQYANIQQSYGDTSIKLYSSYVYALLLIYLFSTMIIYLIIPLILKNGRTIFMKIFKLSYVNFDNQNVQSLQIIIRYIFQFILYLITPTIIMFLTLDNTTFISVAFTNFFKYFNLLALGALSFIIILCNMIFTFYSKKKEQTLVEFIAKIIEIEDEYIKVIEAQESN